LTLFRPSSSVELFTATLSSAEKYTKSIRSNTPCGSSFVNGVHVMPRSLKANAFLQADDVGASRGVCAVGQAEQRQ